MKYTKEEIAAIHENGKMIGAILEEVASKAVPGVTTAELDSYAEKRIREVGGEPSFKGYAGGGEKPFPASVCISTNEELVHGVPGSRVLKEGDLVGLDIGMRYKGLCTDTAVTVAVGKIDEEKQRLLDVTYKSMQLGIAQAKDGNDVNDIARAVQEYVEAQGYSIVRALVGHGVGHQVHEEPTVPNFVSEGKVGDYKLYEGLVIAIEPMVNVGGPEVDTASDGWTVVTKDGSLSAHFEHTVAITENGPEVLTLRPSEKKFV